MVNGKEKVEGQEGAKIIRLIQQWNMDQASLLEQEKQNCVKARHALLREKAECNCNIIYIHTHAHTNTFMVTSTKPHTLWF